MDSELVNKIVEQVVDALGRQGATTRDDDGWHGQVEDLAVMEPPNVSRPSSTSFRLTVPPVENSTAKQSLTVPPVTSKVFITAEALQQRLVASKGGVIELATNEFLTPAAVDLVEQKNLSVVKTDLPTGIPDGWHGQVEDLAVEHSEQATAKQSLTVPPADVEATQVAPTDTKAATVGLVVDKPGEKVRSVTGSLSHDGIGFSSFDQSSCWMENLQAMCRSVASGEPATGVVVLPYAADAMVLANKITGIRAVQGTRIASVKAAIRHFGANVLILEHAVSTFHELRTMIRVFTKGRGNLVTSSLLLEAVGRLEMS